MRNDFHINVLYVLQNYSVNTLCELMKYLNMIKLENVTFAMPNLRVYDLFECI